MDANQLQKRLVDQYNLRVEPETSHYVLRRLTDGGTARIPIMGGDARTGVAVRELIDLRQLTGDRA